MLSTTTIGSSCDPLYYFLGHMNLKYGKLCFMRMIACGILVKHAQVEVEPRYLDYSTYLYGSRVND